MIPVTISPKGIGVNKQEAENLNDTFFQRKNPIENPIDKVNLKF